MPELPEVELVRRWTERVAQGQPLESAHVLDPKTVRTGSFADLRGLSLIRARRFGKHLAFEFGKTHTSITHTAILHLRMTGRFESIPQHTTDFTPWRFVWTFPSIQLGFRDVRRLGHIDVSTPEAVQTLRASLGPEPWPTPLPASTLFNALSNTRRAVKTALMDQSVLAGVGNIVANEALWRARIHPKQKAYTLSLKACATLAEALCSTCQHILEHEDGPVPKYVGEPGVDRTSIAYLSVYGRAGQPCPRENCHHNLHNTKVSGRGTVWCPQCQPLAHDAG